MVASYDNTSVDWNVEAEETALRTYTIEHSFNNPAKCMITLADPTGAIMRKYNADADDVYLGVGKITLEDPTGTDIFYGRIKRVTADQAAKTAILECYDWLDQLDDEIITYDMREKLGTTDMRQAVARSDIDGTFVGVAEQELIESAKQDNGGAFTDQTTEARDAAVGDMDLTPDVPVDNDAYYFGFYNEVTVFDLVIETGAEWNATLVWEYWDGDSWESLADISDATNNFVAEGQKAVSWTAPGDWAEVAVDGTTCYWVRARITSLTETTVIPKGSRAIVFIYYFYDDGPYDSDGGMAFANDAYNGMYLIFTTGMAGTKTWRFYPYDSTATDHDIYSDDVHTVWVNTQTEDTGYADNDWTLEYVFRTELGHNDVSAFYVDDSLTEARVYHRGKISQLGGGNHCEIQFYDNDGAAYVALIHCVEEDVTHEALLTIPSEYLANGFLVSNTGEIKIMFDVDRAAGNALLATKHLYIELDCTTTGYSTPVSIIDTINPNKLRVGTNLTAAATQIWEKIPYCVVKPIHDHLESATGPILGGDTIVTLTAADGNIEDTTGLSTTQFKDKSRLRIAQSLANEDSAVLWITLGGVTVTYKKTFVNDTMQLTDGDILDWQSLHDYNSMINSVDVYGARIGDYEIYQQSENAASKLKYLSTKSKVIRNSGLVSDAEASDIGIAIAARENDVSQMVGCTIHGNTATAGHATTIKLGEIVEITSSYLWPNAAKDYIVSRFIYDSVEHKTYLTLYPKASTGERTIEFPNPTIDIMTKKIEADKFTPDPVTHEVS